MSDMLTTRRVADQKCPTCGVVAQVTECVTTRAYSFGGAPVTHETPATPPREGLLSRRGLALQSDVPHAVERPIDLQPISLTCTR